MKDQNRPSNGVRKSEQTQLLLLLLFFWESNAYAGFLLGFVRKSNQAHYDFLKEPMNLFIYFLYSQKKLIVKPC